VYGHEYTITLVSTTYASLYVRYSGHRYSNYVLYVFVNPLLFTVYMDIILIIKIAD
jgi:hypothetical protein